MNVLSNLMGLLSFLTGLRLLDRLRLKHRGHFIQQLVNSCMAMVQSSLVKALKVVCSTRCIRLDIQP